MKSKIFWSMTILMVAGLFAVGRFNINHKKNPALKSASLYNGAAETVSQRNLAPDFLLEKLDGGTISLSEFRGKKPVVVDFWASWCPNCRRDMPNLNSFYEKYKDKVEVIGVNLQEDKNTVKNFIASRGISFSIALDPYGEASRAFGIQYTNTHFLIDINGNLVRTIPGDIRESDIISLIQ